jgi:CBS domain-containing protein
MPTRPLQEVVRSRKLVTVASGTSVREAAGVMARERVGALPVVDGGRLAGIFTERDALVRVLAQGRDPDATAVAQVMTANPVTVQADRPLNHALHLMFEGGFRHVPVMQGERVVGVVSARDALGPEITQFEAELRQRDDFAEKL